jgi:hypothetical protein
MPEHGTRQTRHARPPKILVRKPLYFRKTDAYCRQHMSKTFLPSYVLQGRHLVAWLPGDQHGLTWQPMYMAVWAKPVAHHPYKTIEGTSVADVSLVDRYYTIMGYTLACTWPDYEDLLVKTKKMLHHRNTRRKATYACEISAAFPCYYLGKEQNRTSPICHNFPDLSAKPRQGKT